MPLYSRLYSLQLNACQEDDKVHYHTITLQQASQPTNLTVIANNPVQENNHRRRWTRNTFC